MRTLLPCLLLALVTGCAETEPTEPDFDFDAFFKTPSYYTVVKGDSLRVIGQKYAVSVDDLKRWNGLESDVIDIGQVLLVWEGGEPPKAPSGLARGGSRKAPPQVKRASMLPDDWEAPVLAGTSGILGSLGGGTDLGSADLDATLASTRTVRADKVGPSTSLAGRARIGGGEAEAMGVSIDRRFTPSSGTGTRFGTGAIAPPRLSYPSRKSCLAGPSGAGLGDHGMASANGLSSGQIRGALGRFVHHTAKCIPPGSSGAFSVTVELTVGCDGRVTDADVISGGGAPSNVRSCIEKTFLYAGFPAHDMRGGMVFQYPIHYGR